MTAKIFTQINTVTNVS